MNVEDIASQSRHSR